MSTNIYFIIGGVAIAFIIYMVILQKIMKKRNQQQLDNFQNNHSGNPLTEEQKRLLTFGAILFYHRSEDFLEITPKKNQLDEVVHGLKNTWGLNNRDEALERLQALINLNTSSEYDEEMPEMDLIKVKRQLSKELHISLQEVENVKSTYAWDLGRAVSISKWCFWVGYINEEEMWHYMKMAADKASTIGTGWTEFMVSYLLGRSIQGFDLDNMIVECDFLLHGKSPLLVKKKDVDIYQRYSFK